MLLLGAEINSEIESAVIESSQESKQVLPDGSENKSPLVS
jgi:hypothetical protein